MARKFTEKDKRIFEKMKQAVLSIDESAEIILFGSRARGDFKEDSDYDFLILTDKEVNHNLRKNIVSKTSFIQGDEVVCLQEVVRNKAQWFNNVYATDFFTNISAEGVKI
jgi:predicted nucleotidyltransferase